MEEEPKLQADLQSEKETQGPQGALQTPLDRIFLSVSQGVLNCHNQCAAVRERQVHGLPRTANMEVDLEVRAGARLHLSAQMLDATPPEAELLGALEPAVPSAG